MLTCQKGMFPEYHRPRQPNARQACVRHASARPQHTAGLISAGSVQCPSCLRPSLRMLSVSVRIALRQAAKLGT